MHQDQVAWKERIRDGRRIAVAAIDRPRRRYAVRDPASRDSLRLHRWALDRGIPFVAGSRSWAVDGCDGEAMLEFFGSPSDAGPVFVETRYGRTRATPTRRGDARLQLLDGPGPTSVALAAEIALLDGDVAGEAAWFVRSADAARILCSRPLAERPRPDAPGRTSVDGHPVWIRPDGRVDRERYRREGLTRSEEIGHHLFEVYVLEDGAEVWHDLGAGGRAALLARHGRLPWIDRLAGTIVPPEDHEPRLFA